MAEAETARKRFREEKAESGDNGHGTDTKRQCSLNKILSLLESEEEEPTEDLSSIITTLQQELSSSSSSSSDAGAECFPEPGMEPSSGTVEQAPVKGDEEVEVMKHLLEASDDELGIPCSETRRVGEAEDESRGVGEILSYDGFWEFEDEAANYYTLLQLELFMT
ncbi:uncharacterized protein [Aristolochia californica]|uniref:uncharacterized protein n=1 Tax=Aristolochia californica TaxID=171875 RepID=UPI0035D8EDCA